jgi:hypothetical protein
MNEREVTALLERRGAVVPPSDPPIDEILRTSRAAGRHRHRTALLSAGAVLTLIVGVGIAWEAAQDGAPSLPAPAASPLPTQEGYRWVGMSGIAVEVPGSWTTSESPCAPEAVDSVVFDEHMMSFPCLPRIDPRASSLHFETLDSRNFIAEMARRSQQHRVSIGGGVQALVTDPVDLTCDVSLTRSCTSVFGASIEVPSMNLLAWVESPRAAVAADTISSATRIPDGYVAIPPVSNIAQAKAADAIGKLGLAPVSLCPAGGHVCEGDLAVRRTDPGAGTLVAVGTRVSIEISWVTVSGD